MSKGYSVFARGRKLYVKIKDVQGRWIQKRTGFSVGQEAEAERWSREFARRIEAERKAGASGPLTVADPTASGGDFHSPRNAAGERPSASLTAAELDGLVRSIREQLAPPAAVPPIAEADVALAGDTLSPPAHVPNHPLDRDRGAPGRLTIDPGEDGYKLVCEDGVVLARSRSTVACERIVAALRAHPQAPAPAPGSRPPGVPPRDPAAPLHPMAEDPATDVLTSATSPPVDREGLARIACGKAVDGALGEIARQCGRSAMLAEARTSGMLAAAPFLARLAPRPVAAFDLPAIEWSSDDTPRRMRLVGVAVARGTSPRLGAGHRATAPRSREASMTDADGTFQLPMPPHVQAPTVLGEAAAVRLGDAYDLMESLDSSSVDLLITSPPYWGHRSYGRDHNWKIHEEWQRAGGTVEAPPPYEWYRKAGGVLGLEPFPDWYVAHLVEIFERARPRLKATASVWVNVGDTYFARWSSIRESGRQGLGDNARVRRRTPMGDYRQEKQLLMIPARFAIAMQARRWILRNDVIWFKPNVPPRPEADRLRLSHEHFFHFVLRPKEGRAKYHYDLAAVEPRAHDVIEVPVRAGQDGHSATFPTDLIRPRILSSCPPGGLVLDPFCGTGRALAVAAQNGRRAIGFDVSPEFAKVARGTAGSTAAPAKGNARARRAIVKPGKPGGRIRKSNGSR